MSARDHDTELGGRGRAFPPTRASAVRELRADAPDRRRAAQEALVRAYWKPCFAHARAKWSASNEDAKEFVQGFFTRLLTPDALAGFDPARGRFRTFLRAAFDHHVQHEREAAARDKRGGGRAAASFDLAAHDVADRAPTPEEELDARFRREWARRLFELAIEGLEARCAELDKRAAFEVFPRYDLHDAERGPRPSYAQIGAELALPETQVTNHLHWARKELRALVYAELRAITADEHELAEEARWLLGGTDA